MDFGREKGVFPLVLIQVKSAAKRTFFGLKNKREKTFLPFKTQLFHIQVVRYAASTIIISQSCLDLLFVNTYKCYNNDIQLNINKISIDKVTTNDIPFRMLEKYPR